MRSLAAIRAAERRNLAPGWKRDTGALAPALTCGESRPGAAARSSEEAAMGPVYLDPTLSDAERREAVFGGGVLVFSPRPAAVALCEFARGMLEEAFHPLEPEHAQWQLRVRDYARIAAELKPAFIHHPESQRLVRELLVGHGCDPESTYVDVPRLRSSTSDGYLTTGIAYAFHPHRDTWYCAPMCQINWWLPVYPVQRENGMAFHPRYWSRGVKNGSRLYDYDEWSRTARFRAAEQIGVDRRVQPRAEEPLDLSDDLRIVGGTGSLTIFSAAQMHSSVPNTSGRTRYSIDFRTVHRSDVVAGGGAANLDSECTGTSLGDFLRCNDQARLPADTIRRYRAGFGR